MRGMRRFVLLTLLAAAPVLVMLAAYIVTDPFHVVKPYSGHAYVPGDTVALTVNTGYVSVESFQYYNPSRHYNSFIFGSSLSGYYRVDDWLRHLPAGASACHFNASRETLHGILNKLHYLAQRDVPVRHALIVMEEEMLRREPIDNDVLYVQHPRTTRAVSWWKFHQLYFNAFRHPQVALYALFPRWMTQQVLDDGYATTDIPDRIEPYNESYYGWADSLIAVNPQAFFTPQHIARYRLPVKMMPCPDRMTPAIHQRLQDIAALLHDRGTDYQVIIPPHYGYEAISDADLADLEAIFGANRVHDYSRDADLGTNLRYYYDDGHLIAAQCARLMDSTYRGNVTLSSPYLLENQ